MHELERGIDSLTGSTPVRWAFWKRGLALYLDIALVELTGLGVGQLWFGPLTGLDYGGLPLGFAIALLYFGWGNSRFGNGQTPGKRLFGVRVVDRNGMFLGFRQSCLRASLLVLTLFPFVRSAFYALHLDPWAQYGQVVPNLLGAIAIYLFVMNRRTRQTLHDFLVDSYVIRTDSSTAVKSRHIWPWHLWISLGVGVAIALIFLHLNAPRPTAAVDSIEPVLIKQFNLRSAQVFGSTFTSNGELQTQTLRAIVVPEVPTNPADPLATQTAKTLFARYPDIEQFDTVAVTVKYGYRLGLATGYREFNYRFCPQQGGLLDQRFDAKYIVKTPVAFDLVLNADRNYQPIFMKLLFLEVGSDPYDLTSLSYNPTPLGICKTPTRPPQKAPAR